MKASRIFDASCAFAFEYGPLRMTLAAKFFGILDKLFGIGVASGIMTGDA
jgi:hypothetical protein